MKIVEKVKSTVLKVTVHLLQICLNLRTHLQLSPYPNHLEQSQTPTVRTLFVFPNVFEF